MTKDNYSGPNRREEERRDRRQRMERRSGMERRRGPGRRRSDTRRQAEEGEMNAEQFAFIQAINEYKSVNGKPFPTWTEILDIVLALGYRKVEEPKNIGDL